MPLQSTLRRGQSAPIPSLDLSPSSSTVRVHTRHDPAFRPLKARLNMSGDLLSMSEDLEDPQLVVVVCYPCYQDTTLVPVDKLIEYWETHDFNLPYCFCVIKTGVLARTILFVPTGADSASRGQMVLTCATFECTYYKLSLTHHEGVIEEMFAVKAIPSYSTYPFLGYVREYFLPKGVGQYTPSPTSPSRGRTAAWLITGSPTTPTKRARPSRRALADVVEQSFETAATAGSSPTATSSVSAPLPRTNAGHRLPVKYEDGGVFTQATPPQRRSASAEDDEPNSFEYIPSLHRDETLIGDLLMWYKPATIQKAYEAPPLGDEDAETTLARLTYFKLPGISLLELIRAIGRCPHCGLIMVHELVPKHGCPRVDDTDEEASSAPGPSKKRKLAVPRRSTAYLANTTGSVPRIGRNAQSGDSLNGKGKGKGKVKAELRPKMKAKPMAQNDDDSLYHVAYIDGKEVNVVHP
ncbi:hypothetical protein FA95DRAFT_1573908 [Auriscalpium vulgare]|uniref:Uncharacterized protein n=1 Tax=Auriscalpium vulgare TaxID=40419 RepID=A0ACB8RMD3_9AGAM|nr:hypothetical protein FA95DRAFT_1573908 [Auriscalpium vulgare]